MIRPNSVPAARVLCAMAACFSALTPVAADEAPQIEYRPLKFGAVQEFGSIREGLLVSPPVQVMQDEWVDHFGVFLTQEAVVNRRLELQLGLGGVFQFPKPEKISTTYGGSLYKMFFIGPSVAKAMVSFGNPEKPVFALGGGMFPYKYNPDAANLGEYLFRTTPYPTTIMTGGLTFVNDNAAYLQGFHGKLQLGNLTLDALLTTETGMPPLYDWSAGLIATYRIAEGAVEVGAGFNAKRIIPIDPDKTQWKILDNATFTKNGTVYYGDAAYYQNQATFFNRYADTLGLRGNPTDSAAMRARAAALQPTIDSLNLWLADPAVDSIIPEGSRQYFTPAGQLVMARMSVDFNKLLGIGGSKDPFRIFAEAALLGVKNYPIFYEKQSERLPIMVGARIPTFGVLNQLVVQFEYFNSPWSNNSINLGGAANKNRAIPDMPDPYINVFSTEEYNDVTKDDNYAWSVLLSRQIVPHLNLNAQFARDHMRTVGTNWFYGGRLEPIEVLYRNSSWYWMIQLAWGI